MSAAAQPVIAETASPPSAAGRWWRTIDAALQWAGDHLNPILVKEARQALKSKQFLITFLLLLAAAWVWTILGVALVGPDIYYSSQGPDLFAVYYFFLAFALYVIVPFGAFRSLASEQEDRTYALLQITTLNARQIIRGKLGSAVLQMIIYLSSITPCLAFTYMLRGLDFPTILFLLFWTFLTSLALSLVALLAATLTSEKHWQVVLSVVLVAGLLLGAWGLFMFAMMILYEAQLPMQLPEFWQANAAVLTGFAGYFALFFYAAAAQLTFITDNRSTRLRIVMLAQQALFTGWMVWLWIAPGDFEWEFLIVYLSFVAMHWYFMGTLMTGESAELSPRVMRRLPQSFLGRVFLTWFNPGPGTGYLFAIGGTGAAAVLALLAVALTGHFQWHTAARGFPTPGWRTTGYDKVFPFAVLAFCYVAMYLGLGALVIRLLRRVTNVPLFLGLLLHVLIVLLGTFVPLIVHLMSPDLRDAGYTLLHVTNPFYTVFHVVEGRGGALAPETDLLLCIVPLLAGLVFVLNLPAVVREVQRVRIARPERIAEEDAALAAVKHPPKPVRLSPWD